MNYVHFTFENIFDYKSTLEQIPKENTVFADYIANINSLQLSFDYKYTLVPYQDFMLHRTGLVTQSVLGEIGSIPICSRTSPSVL